MSLKTYEITYLSKDSKNAVVYRASVAHASNMRKARKMVFKSGINCLSIEKIKQV